MFYFRYDTFFLISLSLEIKSIVERTTSLPISRESLPKAPDTNEDGYPHTPSKLIMSFTLFLTASSNLGFNNTSKTLRQNVVRLYDIELLESQRNQPLCL